jgi:NADH-quinone oxidoreductase subunit N
MTHSLDIGALLPFAILGFAALANLATIAVRRTHVGVCGITALSLTAALAWLPHQLRVGPSRWVELLAIDNFAPFYFGLIIAASLAVALLAYGYLERQRGHREEFYVLLLLATIGAMTVAASAHLASFFMGLETLSVSVYVMAAYTHFRRASLEASIKYLVLAGASTAFMLFGLALLYAQTGRLDLVGLRIALIGPVSKTSPLVLGGFALLIVGLGFKLGVAPFHLWAPDVYQGAPAPATAFIATASKGAVVAFLLRFFHASGLQPADPAWIAFAALAVASMFLGNLLALRQDNIKRILAYSSIAHLGYVLVAFLAGGAAAEQAVAFYLAAYVTTTLAAFGVVAALSTRERDAEQIDDLRGLFWRRPFVAAVFAGALLSLAGIPLTAGFVGKFAIVAAGVRTSLWALTAILLLNSAIGLFYYLRLLAAMYRHDDEAPAVSVVSPALPLSGGIALAGLTVALVLLGVAPEPLMALLRAAGLN